MSSNLLVRHIRMFHGFLPGRTLRLHCVETGCGRMFGTFSGFRKHLNTRHSDRSASPLGSADAIVVSDVHADVSQMGHVQEMPSTSDQFPSTNKSTLDMCASAVAQLKAAGLGQSTLNSFVSSMEEAFSEIHSQAKNAALQCLSSQDVTTRNRIEQTFTKIENPFTSLNSESKRHKHFGEKWRIVDPVEKVLGTRFDSRRNKATGAYEQVVVTDKFAYIPILETLKTFFLNPNLSAIFNLQHTHKEGLYLDITDASYLKDNPLFSEKKDALQIQLFYDDFETANPLGSKKGIHKLGAIYFTLRNFPPVYNSSLSNIYLCALFHAQDIKRYGFNSILEPLVFDLKILESEGLKVPKSDHVLYGSIVQVTGDNLGLHSIFGFVESFVARYCCRFCLLEKEKFQSVFCEDNPEVRLRTVELHADHCQTIDTDPSLPHIFGVKRKCLLNSLLYFNTANNFAVDLMHDVLEGVGQFEMKLLLQFLQENYITAEQLDRRIHAFDYGYNQQRNRPPGVKLLDGSNDLGLNAIQSWCLLRNLPLIFGDLIERENKHWELLILLLQIVNILFSPVVSEGMTVYLKHLISDHHKLFKQLFPTVNLLPKHHFMLHYPRSIRKIGPLVHFWCMRYEAKHNFFKKQVKSFKNITLTLARKHQSCMALYQESFSKERLTIGPGKITTLNEIREGPEIASKLGCELSSEVCFTKWVKCHGTEYRPDFIVCTEIVSEMPVFCMIKTITVVKETVVFYGKLMETVYFDEHFFAFKIRVHPEKMFKVFTVNELCYYRPFDVQMKYGTFDPSKYVVPYCQFVDKTC